MGIYKLLTDMNVGIGTEAVKFLLWEHINGIFLAVQDTEKRVLYERRDEGILRKRKQGTLRKTLQERRENGTLRKKIKRYLLCLEKERKGYSKDGEKRVLQERLEKDILEEERKRYSKKEEKMVLQERLEKDTLGKGRKGYSKKGEKRVL